MVTTRAIAVSISELTYSLSNIIVTVVAIASLDVADAAIVNAAMICILLTGSIARGVLGESLAIRFARTGTDSAALHRALWRTLLVGAAIAGAVSLAFALGGVAIWIIILTMAAPLNSAYSVWRSAIAHIVAPRILLIPDCTWLIVEVAFFLLIFAGSTISAVFIALGWAIGLVSASAVAFAIGRPSRPVSVFHSPTRKHRPARSESVVYSTESLLAFGGPQIVALSAAAVLSAADFNDFRLITVIFGPLALIASGIRLAYVGTYAADSTARTPSARSVLGSLVVLTIISFTAGLLLVTISRGLGFFGRTVGLSIAAALLIFSFGRSIAAVASLSISRLRSAAVPFVFLVYRVTAVVLSIGLMSVGAQHWGLTGSLVGVGIAATLSGSLYISASGGRDTRTGDSPHMMPSSATDPESFQGRS